MLHADIYDWRKSMHADESENRHDAYMGAEVDLGVSAAIRR